MSGLQITVTSAGRAAQVNAENTGTAPVTITQIGITDQAVVTDDEMTALPGELKRLATFAGAAVADDTIHVTIRDDSADVYSLRGFGLYLGDGTLYAVYGQADVVLEKSAQAMMLLATDIIFANIDATSLTFGDTNWINPPATTTVQGVVELATDAEAIAAADATRALTPAAAKAATDSRFGVGAPSSFFKTLMALTTAALIRVALELGTAATRNEGAGSNLDADKLDGQQGAFYQAWANLTGVPASFPPSGHNHAWSDVTGPPATATRWPVWNEVSDKPTLFAPSAHTHAAADITSGTFADARIPALAIAKTTGLQDALNAKANLTGATFTGLTRFTGQDIVKIRGGADARITFEDSAGVRRGMLNMNPANGVAAFVSYDVDGGTQLGLLELGVGGLKYNGSAVHHAGNFNPATKANLSGAEFTGDTSVNGVSAATYFRGAVNAILGTTGAGTVYLRPNGHLSATAQTIINSAGTMTVGGAVTASSFAQSSSRRYKTDEKSIDPARALAILSGVEFVSYIMKADGSEAAGVIAEDLAGGPFDFAVIRNEYGAPEAVNYQPLFVIACAAIKGVADRLAAIEAKA